MQHWQVKSAAMYHRLTIVTRNTAAFEGTPMRVVNAWTA